MRLALAVLVVAALGASPCLAQSDAYSSLSYGVRPAKPHYKPGEPVVFEFAIRNRSSSTVSLSFPSAKQFDMWVTQGNREVFRASRGAVYAQAQTSITLRPGETRSFTATWDQRDARTGRQTAPGVYTVSAQLTASVGNSPAVASEKVRIGISSFRAAMVPMTVCEAVAYAPENLGRKVMVSATYRGNAPERNEANTRGGPPVDAGDWVVCDATGCIYVTGKVTLDPAKDAGTRVTVVGTIARTAGGQVYLILQSATTSRGSVCPAL